MNSDEVTIRSVQHFLYCPHRWGLIEIGNVWSENVFVTKSNIMHERVHNANKSYALKGRKVFTGISVYNDLPQYNLYGITDCIELIESEDGISIDDTGKKYRLCLVEYKPTKPKHVDYYHDDLMQVFAQKICVDYVFKCDCEAVLYYADVKKRVSLPLRENFEEYDYALKAQLLQMRGFLSIGKIPPIKSGQRCNGCSLRDICMPKAKTPKRIRALIEGNGEDYYEKTS